MDKIFLLLVFCIGFLTIMVSDLWAYETNKFDTLSVTKTASSSEVKPVPRKGVYRGFSGGMMLHGGWLFNQNKQSSEFAVSGFTKGIGGSLKVHLWKHFRIGTEGFVSTLKLKNEGYVRMGWSGALFEFWSTQPKCSPYFGVTIGGGSKKSLYMIEGNTNDWEKEDNVVYNTNPFFALDPYVGCELSVTQKFKLSFRLDWLLAIRKQNVASPTGPRFYVGFIFGH